MIYASDALAFRSNRDFCPRLEDPRYQRESNEVNRPPFSSLVNPRANENCILPLYFFERPPIHISRMRTDGWRIPNFRMATRPARDYLRSKSRNWTLPPPRLHRLPGHRTFPTSMTAEDKDNRFPNTVYVCSRDISLCTKSIFINLGLRARKFACIKRNYVKWEPRE